MAFKAFFLLSLAAFTVAGAAEAEGTCQGATCKIDDRQTLLQSRLIHDEDTEDQEPSIAEEDEDEDDEVDNVEGLHPRAYHSMLYGVPLVLGNVSNFTALYSQGSGGAPIEDITHKFGDLASDAALLASHVSGFITMMQEEVLEEGDDSCPSDSLVAIGGCIQKAMCLLQSQVDAHDVPNNKDLKKYALLEEMHAAFKDITWPQAQAMLALVEEKYDATKPVKHMAPAEHACDANKAWDKSNSLLEMSSELASAYATSATLVNTAKATHAIMDAHNHNASVDATVAALHAAWKPSCELLRCDHTNYRDLWRASHAHSSSLLDMGASARHMQVHIQTRKTLELRMQQFLAEHAKDEATARKIHKHEATEWSGAPKQYFSQTRGAYAEFMVDRAFSLPVSTRVYPLRLFDGEKLENSLAEEGESHVLDTIRGDKAKAVNDEYAYKSQDDDDYDDEANLAMVEKENAEDADLKKFASTRRFGKVGKFFKKAGKAVGIKKVNFKDIGNAVGKFGGNAWNSFKNGVQATADAIVAADPTGFSGAAVGIANSVVNKLKSVDYGKLVNDVGNDISSVTNRFANAALNAANQFAKFLLSLFACFGTASEGYVYGYGFKVPCDAGTEGCVTPNSNPPWAIAFGFGVTGQGTGPLNGFVHMINAAQGQPYGFGIAVAASIVAGACPGGAATGGARVGIGVSVGFNCNGGSNDCSVQIAIGAMGSALIPSEGCAGPASIGPAKCFFAYSVMVSVMCCKYGFISKSGDCR